MPSSGDEGVRRGALKASHLLRWETAPQRRPRHAAKFPFVKIPLLDYGVAHCARPVPASSAPAPKRPGHRTPTLPGRLTAFAAGCDANAPESSRTASRSGMLSLLGLQTNRSRHCAPGNARVWLTFRQPDPPSREINRNCCHIGLPRRRCAMGQLPAMPRVRCTMLGNDYPATPIEISCTVRKPR